MKKPFLGNPRLSYLALQEIKNLSAFSIQGAELRKINQFAREYTFPDNSVLRIYKSGKGESYLENGGLCDCVSLLRVNSFGKN